MRGNVTGALYPGDRTRVRALGRAEDEERNGDG